MVDEEVHMVNIELKMKMAEAMKLFPKVKDIPVNEFSVKSDGWDITINVKCFTGFVEEVLELINNK